MVGIGIHAHVPHRPAVWIAAGALAAVGAAVYAGRSALCSAFLAVALLAAAIAAGQNASFQYPADHISAFTTDDPRLARIELRIVEPPRIITRSPGSRGEMPTFPPKQVMQGEAVRVMTWTGWQPCSGRMLIQLNTPHPRLAAGQTLRVLGMLQRPGPAMNPGQFDWASYYREQRVLASLHIPEPGNVEILAEPGGFHPLQWLQQEARTLLAAGFDGDHSLDHALLRALLLGDNDPELRDVQDDFRRTGTSHHLSISGLHIAVLGGFVYLLCRLMRLSPRVCAGIMIAFVLLYGFVALPSPPVVRSVALCVSFGVGRMLRRTVDAIQLLALSILGMLIYHPPDLFNAGFQLSFGTVLGLLIFTRPVQSMFRLDDDPVVVGRSGTIPLRRRAAMFADRNVMTAILASVVAWAVSLPLVARHFEQMNPWAVAAGLLLAPIVFLSLVGGLLKVVLTLLFPSGAALWATASSQPIEWMRWTVSELAKLPHSDVPMPAPSIVAIFFFYLAFCAVLPRWRLSMARWGTRGGVVAACIGIFFLPVQRQIAGALPNSNALRVTFLAIGAGQCAVVQPPSGRVVLIDAGSSSLSDLLFKCLGPYLRHEGFNDVDSVFITHANYDHFSAVGELASVYGVREVLIDSQFKVDAKTNGPAEAMLVTLDRIDHPPRLVAPGDHIPLGRDTDIEILWPPNALEGVDISDNDASLVFRLTHAGQSMLITGDIQDDAMRELLKTPEKLHADVLVAPHHGSSESLTESFIRTVAPKYVLSSNDRTLSRKQVRCAEICKSIGVTLLRTNEVGAITVTFHDDQPMELETFLPRAQASISQSSGSGPKK